MMKKIFLFLSFYSALVACMAQKVIDLPTLTTGFSNVTYAPVTKNGVTYKAALDAFALKSGSNATGVWDIDITGFAEYARYDENGILIANQDWVNDQGYSSYQPSFNDNGTSDLIGHDNVWRLFSDGSAYLGNNNFIVYAPSNDDMIEAYANLYMLDNSNISLSNGSRVVIGNTSAGFGRGDFDNGTGGNNGVSMYCAAGYQFNWQGGKLSASQEASNGNLIPLEIQSNVVAPNYYTAYSGSYRTEIAPGEISLVDDNSEFASGHDFSKVFFANNTNYYYAEYGTQMMTIQSTDTWDYAQISNTNLSISNNYSPGDGQTTITKSYIKTEFPNESSSAYINSNGKVYATHEINVGEMSNSGIFSQGNETKIGDFGGNNSGTKLIINSDDNYVDVQAGYFGNIIDNYWGINNIGFASFKEGIEAGQFQRSGIQTDGYMTYIGDWTGNGESTTIVIDDYNERISVNKDLINDNDSWSLGDDGTLSCANNLAIIDASGNGHFNSLNTDGVQWQLGSVSSPTLINPIAPNRLISVTIDGIGYKISAQQD